MKDKSYANYFKLDMSDIDNGNITIESNFYNETVIYKNETKTDVLSEVLFDGTKEKIEKEANSIPEYMALPLCKEAMNLIKVQTTPKSEEELMKQFRMVSRIALPKLS